MEIKNLAMATEDYKDDSLLQCHFFTLRPSSEKHRIRKNRKHDPMSSPIRVPEFLKIAYRFSSTIPFLQGVSQSLCFQKMATKKKKLKKIQLWLVISNVTDLQLLGTIYRPGFTTSRVTGNIAQYFIYSSTKKGEVKPPLERSQDIR